MSDPLEVFPSLIILWLNVHNTLSYKVVGCILAWVISKSSCMVSIQ